MKPEMGRSAQSYAQNGSFNTLNTRYTKGIAGHHYCSDQPSRLCLVALTVSLGGVVTLVNNQVLRSVVLTAAEVLLQNVLDTCSVSGLGVNRCTGHVRNSCVATTPGGVRGVSEWVVLWSWLWKPHITTVTTELTRLESLGDVLLDHDGTTSGVDEP